MGDMEPREDLDLDSLLDQYVEVKARIALLEWREGAEAILDEIREVRDDFREMLRTAAKILCEADRQALEKALMRSIEGGERGSS
jgi:hypothetical protein